MPSVFLLSDTLDTFRWFNAKHWWHMMTHPTSQRFMLNLPFCRVTSTFLTAKLTFFFNIFLISDHETDNFAWLISSKSTCWPCHSSRFVSKRWLNISVCPTVNYGILESNGDIFGIYKIYNSCKFTSTHGTSPPRGRRCEACAALNWPPCLFEAAWIVWGIWMHMGVDTDL